MRNQAIGQRNVDCTAERALFGGSAVIADRGRLDVGGHAARDTLVERVDRAADGVAAEQQNRGAVEHVDMIDRERVEDDGVVDRDIRGVKRPDPVGQHANPITTEAAQNWA